MEINNNFKKIIPNAERVTSNIYSKDKDKDKFILSTEGNIIRSNSQPLSGKVLDFYA